MAIGNISVVGAALLIAAFFCAGVAHYAVIKMHAEIARSGGIPDVSLRNVPAVVYEEYRRRFPDSRLPQVRVIAGWLSFPLAILAVIVILATAE
jgi:hypothetical protein